VKRGQIRKAGRGVAAQPDPLIVDAKPSLAVPLAAVTAAWLLAFSRWVSEDETVPWDAKNQFYAFFRFLAQSFHDGVSPFWNPYHYGGHPSIADPQSLIFSPLFVIAAALDPAPSMRMFDLVVYLHLLIGGLALVGYGWRCGWLASASVLAAVVFMLGGAAAGRLNHTGIIASYGLFPLAMLTLNIMLERRSKLFAVAFAATAASVVLGRNQVALMLCFVLVALTFGHIANANQPLRYLRERAACLGLATSAATGLIAVPLLLTAQFAELSNRPSLDLSTALYASLHPTSLLSMAVPNVFGSLNMMDLGYWGPQAAITPDVSATDDSFNYVFVGVVPIAVLLLLGVCRGGLLRQGARTWTAILVVALLFSLGRYSPLFPFVFEHVPGFSYFRRPVDGLFIVGLAIAVLAGHLTNAYVRHESANLHRGAVAAVTLAGIGLIVGGIGLAQLTGHAIATMVEIAAALPVVVAASVLLLRPDTTVRRGMAAVALAVLATAQLLFYNAASRLNGEPAAIYRALEAASGQEQAALELLLAELTRRHREGTRPRVEILGMGGAWQNLAMVKSIEATNGYNPLRIGLFDRLIIPGDTPSFVEDRKFDSTFSSYDCPLARAIGLEYLVAGHAIAEIEQQVRHGRVDVLMAGPTVWIYRFGKALPRVKFHTRVEVADADALTQSGQLLHPPVSDRAILDDETPPTRQIWRTAAGEHDGHARLLGWRPDRIEIDVDAPTAGVLVVRDTFYPGWTAYVDGRPTPILRADTLFRGVEVPAGRHSVVMAFEPLSPANLQLAVSRVFGSGRKVAARLYPNSQAHR